MSLLSSASVRWLTAAVVVVAWAGGGSAGGGAAVGCSDTAQPFNPVGSATGSGGGGGGANVARPLFDELGADFLAQCGDCHAVGGVANTPFLGDLDGTKQASEYTQSEIDTAYDAVTSWPGFIVKDANLSVLLSWPFAGQHNGPEPQSVLEADLLAWVTAEADYVKDVGEEPIPTIPPFKPFIPGFNAVYLDALGPEYTGMAVTFQAQELTDNTLSLTNMEVHPTAKKGLAFEHPLFTVFASGSADGDPDPVDSFSNVVHDFQPGESGVLGPGTLVLTNWVKGGKLSIAFEVINIIDPSAMGGAGGGVINGSCAALSSFMANVSGPLGNCTPCHAGQNNGATNAVDMSQLSADPDNTCGQVLNRINLGTPNSSQLFITTDPAGAASHPFKFNGNTGNFNAFKDAVTIWIQQEAQAQ